MDKMLNGVIVVGKRFLVKNKALLGTCVDVDSALNIVLDTDNGLQTYNADDLIELVGR